MLPAPTPGASVPPADTVTGPASVPVPARVAPAATTVGPVPGPNVPITVVVAAFTDRAVPVAGVIVAVVAVPSVTSRVVTTFSGKASDAIWTVIPVVARS